tara:strand:+ start:79 stop:1254 length:1176 start_codon:yes stop_codon:yes gene_type:complete
MNTHIEFFSGVGQVGAGLEGNWKTIWANDISKLKCDTYATNYPGTFIVNRSIQALEPEDIPDEFEMSSATFPCTNTSAAGDRTGLMGIKSGVVYRYVELLKQKGGAQCHPLSLLENPLGIVSRNKGRDLRELVSRLNTLGYSICLMNVDAKHFVPQSRPRVLFACCAKEYVSEEYVHISKFDFDSANSALIPPVLARWLKSNMDLDLIMPSVLPSLPERTLQLEHIIDFNDPDTGNWADSKTTLNFLNNLRGKHLELFNKLVSSPYPTVSTISRRGRSENGVSYNATEISVSGLAPCIRPYKGGSSRAWVLLTNGKGGYKIKVISPREAAALMGFSSSFKLPKNKKDAYSVAGDAVVRHCIKWFDENVLSKIKMARACDFASTSEYMLSYI